MKYILAGNPADVQNVLQENRIRVERGMITLTPLTDTVTKEDYEALAAHAKDLEEELESLKAADTKDAPVADEKAAPAADTKEAPVPDEKEEAVADSKKTKKGK